MTPRSCRKNLARVAICCRCILEEALHLVDIYKPHGHQSHELPSLYNRFQSPDRARGSELDVSHSRDQHQRPVVHHRAHEFGAGLEQVDGFRLRDHIDCLHILVAGFKCELSQKQVAAHDGGVADRYLHLVLRSILLDASGRIELTNARDRPSHYQLTALLFVTINASGLVRL